MKDPFRDMPRAIYISIPLVTVIYVLANVAYCAILSPAEIKSSNAVAMVITHLHCMFLTYIDGFHVVKIS